MSVHADTKFMVTHRLFSYYTKDALKSKNIFTLNWVNLRVSKTKERNIQSSCLIRPSDLYLNNKQDFY